MMTIQIAIEFIKDLFSAISWQLTREPMHKCGYPQGSAECYKACKDRVQEIW